MLTPRRFLHSVTRNPNGVSTSGDHSQIERFGSSDHTQTKHPPLRDPKTQAYGAYLILRGGACASILVAYYP